MHTLAILSLVCLAARSHPLAQADRNATLQVTVVDETRGVLPGATVTLVGIEASNKAAVIAPALTSPQGQVKFESLASGALHDHGGVLRLPDANAVRTSGSAAARTGRWSCCRSIA